MATKPDEPQGVVYVKTKGGRELTRTVYNPSDQVAAQFDGYFPQIPGSEPDAEPDEKPAAGRAAAKRGGGSGNTTS